ncbi:unnamed protein product [Symbiodinium sp. CCMP2592]|nr:unnamed protein product [Symbiodinium sp. CCMP2592]
MSVLGDGLSSDESSQQVKEEASEDDQEEAADREAADVKVPSAEMHVSESSMMKRIAGAKRKKNRTKPEVAPDSDDKMEVKEEAEDAEQAEATEDVDMGVGEPDEPLAVSDFSVSTFACLCWMSQMMAKGPRADARWTLSKVEVQARARAWLVGLQDTFWQDVDIDGLRISEGLLSVASVAEVFGNKAVKGLGKEDVSVVNALASLQADAARRSLSKDRRRLSEKMFSRLLKSLAAAIDGSREKPIWTDVRVESLDQLRTRKYCKKTARGYRKISHGCKEAVLQSDLGHSVGAALQAQGHFASKSGEVSRRNKDRPGKFLEAERLSYLASGKRTFAETAVLSVVADAVHIGQEDWLNVLVCDPAQDLSFVLPQQVKKGTSITSETWEAMWAGRITKFFQKAGTKGRSPDSVVGGVKQPERQATQEWLRDMSHSLSSVGLSWSTFAAATAEGEAVRQKILILCTDQEATQLAAANYLKFGRSMFVEHVNDPAHRSHNDCHLALAASGLLTFGLMSIGLYNVRYGPWNKGTWFGKVQGMADEMGRSMQPSDPLLLAFFPEILADEGRSQDENTEEHRRAFLESLPNRPFVRAKGSKASQSRFNSLTIAHSELDRDWSAFCLVLATLCVAEGWVKTAAELWSPDATGVGEMAGTTRAAAKSAARKALAKQRGRSVNTLHSMTTFACNADTRSLARTVFYVLQPEGLRCSKMLEELRSKKSTVLYFSSWAHWSYMDTARQHVVRLSELGGLERLGLDLSMVDPAGSEDDREAATVWQDTVARRVTKLTHCLPTAGVRRPVCCTSPRPVGRLACGFLSKWTVSGEVSGGQEAARRPPGHGASHGQVSLGAQSCVVRGGALRDIRLAERQVGRSAQQQARRGREQGPAGRLEGWRGLSKKKLLQSYGRPEVACGTLVTVPQSFEADDWFVRKKRAVRRDSSCSSVPVDVEVIDEDKLAAFSLLSKVVREKLDWSFVETAWWASLAPEGHGLLFPSVDPCYVVRTYGRAALVWPAKLEPFRHEKLVLQTDVTSLCWLHLRDENVEVLELVATSPQRVLAPFKGFCAHKSHKASQAAFKKGARSLGERHPHGIAFKVAAKRPLLVHQEQSGFAGVPEWALRRLAANKGWKIEADEPGHEEDDRLAIACMLSLDASLTKEEVVGRLLHRQEAATWGEGAGVDLEEVIRDTMLAADQDQALQQLAKRRATQQSAVDVRKRGVRTFEHVAKTFARQPAFKAAQAARKEKEKREAKAAKERAAAVKRCYADCDENVDRAVQVSVPFRVRAYRDDPNGRWKLSYSARWAQACRSISWTAVGSKRAGCEVIRQAWKWAETFEGLEISEEAQAVLQKLG